MSLDSFRSILRPDFRLYLLCIFHLSHTWCICAHLILLVGSIGRIMATNIYFKSSFSMKNHRWIALRRNTDLWNKNPLSKHLIDSYDPIGRSCRTTYNVRWCWDNISIPQGNPKYWKKNLPQCHRLFSHKTCINSVGTEPGSLSRLTIWAQPLILVSCLKWNVRDSTRNRCGDNNCNSSDGYCFTKKNVGKY